MLVDMIPAAGNKIIMGNTDDGFPTEPHRIVVAINIFAVLNIPQRDQNLLSVTLPPAMGNAWSASHQDARPARSFWKGLAKKPIFVFDASARMRQYQGDGHRVDKANRLNGLTCRYPARRQAPRQDQFKIKPQVIDPPGASRPVNSYSPCYYAATGRVKIPSTGSKRAFFPSRCRAWLIRKWSC